MSNPKGKRAKSAIARVAEIRAEFQKEYADKFGELGLEDEDFEYIGPRDCSIQEKWFRAKCDFYYAMQIALERVWKRYRAELRDLEKRDSEQRAVVAKKQNALLNKIAEIDAREYPRGGKEGTAI